MLHLSKKWPPLVRIFSSLNPLNWPQDCYKLGMKTVSLILVFLIFGCGKNNDRQAPQLDKNEEALILNKFITERTNRCAKFQSELPSDWFKKTILVPEDPQKPEGKKISVFYYGKITPGQTPIIFFNGGPGFDSFSSYQILKDKPLSLIYIDQRGNGCSDFYPVGDDSVTLSRLAHYGSTGIVADAEEVKKDLKISEPWIIFGQSYGGHIVHRYITKHEKSVKTAFSHGYALNDDGFNRIKNRIASQNRVIKNYIKRYPDDEKRLQIIEKTLTVNDCYRDKITSVRKCGFELLSEIPYFLAFNDDWKNLHSWLKLIVPENELDWNGMDQWVARFVFNGNSPYYIKDMSFLVISFVDRNVPFFSIVNCRRISEELLREGIDIRTNPFTECSSQLQTNKTDGPEFNLNFLKKDILQSSKIIKALTTNEKLKLFLYSGENDQTVPRENFAEEVALLQNLNNFHYTNFPDTGHDGFYSEQKIWDDLKAIAVE